MTLKEKLENHPDKADLFNIMDKVILNIGEHEFIKALGQALSCDELKENLEFIIRMYDLGNEDLYDENEDYNF